MRTIETLKKAKALIADEGKWCRGVLARDVDQVEVHPLAGVACQWCALGAIRYARGEILTHLHVERRLLDRAVRQISDHKTIVTLNDEGRHEDVMLAYQLAIEEAIDAGK